MRSGADSLRARTARRCVAPVEDRVDRDLVAGEAAPAINRLRIDDAEVSALESLWKTLWRNGAERDVLLTIRRDGEMQTITVHATDRMKTLRRPQGI